RLARLHDTLERYVDVVARMLQRGLALPKVLFLVVPDGLDEPAPSRDLRAVGVVVVEVDGHRRARRKVQSGTAQACLLGACKCVSLRVREHVWVDLRRAMDEE